MTPASDSGYRDKNSTAERALSILQMFSEARLSISAVDVADELGVARSTAYRYLETLMQSGLLEEDPSGGFRLGRRVLELSRLARRSHGLSDLALPIMRALAAASHQTVLLTKRIGQAIVCLEREEWAGQYVRLSYERGTQLDLNAGASALVLLAWMPEPESRALLSEHPLKRFTDSTLTNVDDVLARLAEIRASGLSVTYGEVDSDAMGIAAPIFDADGQVVAAVSVVLIQSRLAEGDDDAVIKAVAAAGQELSEQVAISRG